MIPIHSGIQHHFYKKPLFRCFGFASYILRWRLFDLRVKACSQSFCVACLDFDVKILCFRENEDSLQNIIFVILKCLDFVWILFENYLSMSSCCLISINIFHFVVRVQHSVFNNKFAFLCKYLSIGLFNFLSLYVSPLA